jgi:hypothetical protein
MAASPAFAATPKVWAGNVSATADGTPTSRTPTGGTTTLVTGGSSGSKVEEVAVVGVDSALDASVVNIWLHNGSTYFLFDSFQMAGNDMSTTVQGERKPRQYQNLLVPNGWTLQCSCTVASQVIDVVCLGGDL